MDRLSFMKLGAAALAGLGMSKLSAAEKPQADGKLKITEGPYLISFTDSEGFVVFKTNMRAVAKVELTFPDGAKRSFYASHRTAGIKHVGTLHAVRVYELKAGDKISYRVTATAVEKYWAKLDKIQGRFEMGESVSLDNFFGKNPLKFRVPAPSPEIKVGVVNDIHANVPQLEALLSRMDAADMLVMNGDMDSQLMGEDGVFKRFLSAAIAYAKGEKLIYYPRGNHECRGSFAENFSEYFPSPDGRTYCAFRNGPIFFLMLDSCEMRDDACKTNGGFIDLVEYQKEEARWLKEVVASRECRDAPFRVVFQHIPVYTDDKLMHNDAGSRMDAFNKFRKELFYDSILKNANISLMVNAHTHKHLWAEKIEGLNFPVLINSIKNGMMMRADEKSITVSVFDTEGKPVCPDIRVPRK